MEFFKDVFGLFIFSLVQFLFLLHFFFIYELYDYIDNKPNSTLSTHQYFNLFFLFLSFYSHLRASFKDPGEINLRNNRQAVQFYYDVHLPLIKAAQYITEKKTPKVIKKFILEQDIGNLIGYLTIIILN